MCVKCLLISDLQSETVCKLYSMIIGWLTSQYAWLGIFTSWKTSQNTTRQVINYPAILAGQLSNKVFIIQLLSSNLNKDFIFLHSYKNYLILFNFLKFVVLFQYW